MREDNGVDPIAMAFQRLEVRFPETLVHHTRYLSTTALTFDTSQASGNQSRNLGCKKGDVLAKQGVG